MNKSRLIARNMGILLLSQIVSIILSFLYTIYVARYLGVSGFGILSFALAITGIFVILVDLGLNTLMVREVARDKSLAEKYLGNVLVIKTILAFITFLIIVLTLNLAHYPQETINITYLIGISVIFGSFIGIFNSIFQAHEKMEYQSLGQILNSFLMFTGILIAIYYKINIYGFASIYLIVSVIILFYSMIACFWQFVLPKLELNFTFWKRILPEALSFGLTSIFVLIYYYMDTVMISVIIPNSNEVIGWYSAAYMLVMPLSFIPSIFFTSVFPLMSNLYKKSENSLKFAFVRSIRYMIILGIPIAALITILADKIMFIVYGPSYIPAIIVLQILVWSVPLIFIDSAFAYLFSSINRQITVTKIMGIVAIVNIVLNLILIPLYSYIGASVVMVISDFITLILFLITLKNTKYKINVSLIKDILKVFASVLVMLICVMFINDFNLVLIILLSSVVYIGVFFLLKGLDNDDIKIIQNIIFQED